MGYLYQTGAIREDIVNEITRTSSNEHGRWETLEHTTRGNILWTVSQFTAIDGRVEQYIGCHLMRRDRSGWGYKSMNESMHPYYYSCPIKYLDMVPVANEVWREKVRKLLSTKPKVGDVWILSGSTERKVVICSTKPLLGYINTKLYRIPKKMLVKQVTDKR